MYERERNPVGVWRAYAEYRGAKMTSFPEWILEYFDRPARQFWRWTMAHSEPPPRKNIASKIAEALEMKRPGKSGAGNVFVDYSDRKYRALAGKIYFKIHEGHSAYKVKRLIAKEAKVSVPTLDRAWKKYKS